MSPFRRHQLDRDSDLGERLVTARLGPLAPNDVARAPDAGEAAARSMLDGGWIRGAALFLEKEARMLGATSAPTKTSHMSGE